MAAVHSAALTSFPAPPPPTVLVNEDTPQLTRPFTLPSQFFSWPFILWPETLFSVGQGAEDQARGSMSPRNRSFRMIQ